VESHLDHVRTKLGLRSRAQLAAWAATNLPAGD
jgi:DNA-binding CsgD family transcriptional regulator